MSQTQANTAMKSSKSSTSPNPDTTHIATRRNLKSGSKVAAENEPPDSDKKSEGWAGRWSNLGTEHAKRWEKRLYVAKSGGVELGKLAVRIQHLGRREEFRFNTTNRAVAAVQALEIFRFIKTNGWDAALSKYKPEGEAKLETTIGDYLAAARSLSILRPRTFLNYQSALRILAADAFGVKEDR